MFYTQFGKMEVICSISDRTSRRFRHNLKNDVSLPLLSFFAMVVEVRREGCGPAFVKCISRTKTGIHECVRLTKFCRCNCLELSTYPTVPVCGPPHDCRTMHTKLMLLVPSSDVRYFFAVLQLNWLNYFPNVYVWRIDCAHSVSRGNFYPRVFLTKFSMTFVFLQWDGNLEFL